MTTSLARRTVIAGALTVGAGSAALGWALVEAHLFTLRQVSTAVLPAGSAPRKVLHISDLHLTPTQRDKQRWVRALDRVAPDLVAVTGDFLGHRHAVPSVLDALGPLLDRPGVFTLGSNDYLAPRPFNPTRYLSGPSRVDTDREQLPWPDLVAGLTRHGWTDLDNRAARIDLPGWTIDARGVDDPHIELDNYDLVAGPFDAGADLALGVSHAPYRRVLDGMVGDGADLVLAGHTHGGQVCLPGFGALVTNCDMDRRRAKGLHDYTSIGPDGPVTAAMHVSAGIGTSPFAPIRLACRPEATLLTLRARS